MRCRVACIAALAPVLVAGCYSLDPNHCANNNGSEFCTEDGFSFCSVCETSEVRGGCVAQRPEPDCRPEDEAGPGSTTADTDPTAGDTDGMTSGGDCASEGLDPACPAEAPFCIDGTCAGCDAGGDGYCAGLDAGTPVCFGDGRCTQCSDAELGACTDPAKGFCNAGGTCEGCTRHAQCETDPTAPQGCNLETGECLAGLVVWVDADGCMTPPGFGLIDDPYCALETALDNVNLGLSSEITVRVRPSGTPYAGGVGLSLADNAHYVAIVGDGGRPEIAGMTTGLSVSASANRLFLDRLELTGAAGPGIRCTNSGRLWVHDLLISGNEVGIEAGSMCRLEVERTLIHGNSTIGVSVDAATALRLSNAAVVANGTDMAATPGGVSINATDGWLITYSTIAGNVGDAAGVGNDLSCTGGSTGNVRNSVVMGPASGVDASCPDALFDTCAVDLGDGSVSGRGTVDLPYDPTRFADISAGDFHIRDPGASELVDIAVWRAGDPFVDFDDEPRPNVEGAPDWVGADRP